jgi:hypothetical protein
MMKYWRKAQSSLTELNLNSFEKLKRPTKVAALFLLAVLILDACRRPEDDIGIDLQPEDDLFNVGVVDTFTVVARTVREDSLRSDKENPALVGAYMDPVFGFVKASHTTELRLNPNSGSPVFVSAESSPENIVIDSLILVLNYFVDLQTLGGGRNFYGEDGEQFFQVFEISDSLSVDSIYYSNQKPNIVGDDLVKPGQNLIPLTTRFDSVRVGENTLPGQLRIPLKEELAERFFQEGPGVSLSAERFVSLLKGLHITVDEHAMNLYNSGILYFETFSTSGGSGLDMYFRDISPQDTVEFQYFFPIRSASGKYNTLEHDFFFADAGLFNQLFGDGSTASQNVYLQAAGGTKLRVEFPTLSSLRDSTNIAINKAELFIPVNGDGLKDYPPPFFLFAFGLREDGSIFFTQDQIDQLIDGSYDPDTKTYRLIITRFLQQAILEGEELIAIEIAASSSSSSANRVVLNGPEYPNPDEPSNNLKLAITFTNF